MKSNFDPGEWDLEDQQAAIVTYKKPFVDWLLREMKRDCLDSKLFEEYQRDHTIEKLNEEPTVFLVPDFDDRDEILSWIEQRKTKMFAFLLDAWFRDQNQWPKLSAKLFNQWFELKVSNAVVDVDMQESMDQYPELFGDIPDDYK